MASKDDPLLPSSPLTRDSATGGETQARELLFRIEAFLSMKSPSTQRTYRGILKIWNEFLTEIHGEQDSWRSFLCATDTEATLYRAWLEKRPGQNIRQAKDSFSTETSLQTTSRHKTVRDGYQSTLSNATIAKHFAALRRMYRMLLSYDFNIRHNPFDPDRVTSPSASSGQKRPTEMVPFEKVQEIINLPRLDGGKGIRDRAILSLLFGAGLRRSEIVKLRLGDIGYTQKGIMYLHLRATKAKRDAYQALPEWAMEHLKELITLRREEGATDTDFVFISYRGKGGSIPTEHPLSDSGLYKLFKHYCKISGIESRVSPHSARATAITKLLEQGIPHREVQEFSRHSSVQMVEVYDKKRAGIEDNPARKLDY